MTTAPAAAWPAPVPTRGSCGSSTGRWCGCSRRATTPPSPSATCPRSARAASSAASPGAPCHRDTDGARHPRRRREVAQRVSALVHGLRPHRRRARRRSGGGDRRGRLRAGPAGRVVRADERRCAPARGHGRHVDARPVPVRAPPAGRRRRAAGRPRSVGGERPGTERQRAALHVRHRAGRARPARAAGARGSRDPARAGAGRTRAGVPATRRGRGREGTRRAARPACAGAAARRRVLHGAAHRPRRPGHGPGRAGPAPAASRGLPGRAQPGGARPDGDPRRARRGRS
jgi:hypothetical protein